MERPPQGNDAMARVAVDKLATTHVLTAMALASGKTQMQAAEETGVGLRTVQRWMGEPWFKQLVSDYKKEGRARLEEQLHAEQLTSRKKRIAELQKDVRRLDHLIEEATTNYHAGSRKVPDDYHVWIKSKKDLMKQLAQEAGQWRENINLATLTDEQIASLLRELPDDDEE
jgi:hypothetical protein